MSGILPKFREGFIYNQRRLIEFRELAKKQYTIVGSAQLRGVYVARKIPKNSEMNRERLELSRDGVSLNWKSA